MLDNTIYKEDVVENYKIVTPEAIEEAAFFKVVVASTVFFMPPLPARAVPVPG